jgi:hypothetical protein
MDRSRPRDGTGQVFLKFSEVPFDLKKKEIHFGKCETYADSLCSSFFDHIESHVIYHCPQIKI